MTTPMKMVDGVMMPLTDEEIADKEAREAAADLNFTFVRATRNGLLAACDWTQLADSPLSASKQSEWATYRQTLRDLPASSSTVSGLTWPTEPA